MDPKKQAAMKAAMKLISSDLEGMSSKDVLSRMEKKQQASKTADAGISAEEAAELMEGLNPDIEEELEKKDGGTQLEVKKPVEVRPGRDGGVQVDAGTITLQNIPSKVNKAVDNILEDTRKNARKLNEGLQNVSKKLDITPEMRQMREQLRNAAKSLGSEGPILDDQDLDTIINFIKGKKSTAPDGGAE